MSDKKPDIPFSMESEQAVLGAILLNNRMIVEVAKIIEPDDFHMASHQFIFTKILEMWTAKMPIDVLTLQEYIQDKVKLDAIGGPVYIDQLYDRVPVSENAPYYAKVIRDDSRRRKLMKHGKEVYDDAQKTEDIDASMGRAASGALKIAQEQRFQHVKTFEDSIPAYRERYFTRVKSDNPPPIGYSTGYEGLDKYVGVLREECLTIVTARPKVGKTAFAINIALNIARQGGPVLFISLEMTFGSIVNRMLANQTGLDSFYIDMGIHQKHYVKLDKGFGKLEKLPFVIAKPRSLYHIQNQIRQWTHHYDKLALVVIDYAQFVYVKDLTREYDRLSRVSVELKAISEECVTNVMCITQINRAGADRPTMSDIKGSGQFEQDADYIFILHEPDKEKRTPKTSRLEVNLEAHRHGPTGITHFTFQQDKCRFKEELALDNPHLGLDEEEDELDKNFL